MISEWTWPAYVAILLGGVLFVVLFAPLLALQSRRFGRLTLSRTIAVGLFSVYGVALVAYTLLPLPEQDWCSLHTSPPVQWRPFHSLDDLANAGSATAFAVLQVVFNVALFVPWGAFWRRYAGWGVGRTVLSGFAVSLLIESTQGTGLWGLYDCAYRVADVDDLLTNTTGALVGAALAPLLLSWVPRADLDTRRRGEPRPLTTSRRLASALIDVATVTIVGAVVTVVYRAIVLYGLERPLPDEGDWSAQLPWEALAFVLVLALPVLLGEPTPGQRAVWLRPEFPDARPGRRVVRLVGGAGGWALLTLVGTLPPVATSDLASVPTVVAGAWAVVSAVLIARDPEHRGPSFRWAGVALVDSRQPRSQAATHQRTP